MSESTPRSAWSSRLGFILAAAGSSVGLGAIWKFPYMAGTNGGSIFMLPTIAFALTIGLALLMTEMCMGRASRGGAGTAFRKLGTPLTRFFGPVSVLTGALVLGFYSVVGGWCTHYLLASLTGYPAADAPQALRAAFEAFATDPYEAAGCHVLFLSATALVVLAGVQKGIERVGKVLMPLLFILMLVLIGRGLTLPGAMEGVKFLFKPDWEAFTGEALLNAMGFAFFSLSVGSGSMMNYGSYLSKDVNIGPATLWIVVLAVMASVLGGLMIMPAVFAFGLSPDAGPGLTFATMPAVFNHMPLGSFFAVLFFLSLFVAALTSAISILEMASQHFVDRYGFTRRNAVLLVATGLGILGVFCALSFGPLNGVKLFGLTLFEGLDYLTSNIGMPLGCLGIAVVGCWTAWPAIRTELTKNGRWSEKGLAAFRLFAGILAPVLILVVAARGLGLF